MHHWYHLLHHLLRFRDTCVARIQSWWRGHATRKITNAAQEDITGADDPEHASPSTGCGDYDRNVDVQSSIVDLNTGRRDDDQIVDVACIHQLLDNHLEAIDLEDIRKDTTDWLPDNSETIMNMPHTKDNTATSTPVDVTTTGSTRAMVLKRYPQSEDPPIMDSGASKTFVPERIKLTDEVLIRSECTMADGGVTISSRRGKWGPIKDCDGLEDASQALVSPQALIRQFPRVSFVVHKKHIFAVPAQEIEQPCKECGLQIAHLDSSGLFAIDVPALFSVLERSEEKMNLDFSTIQRQPRVNKVRQGSLVRLLHERLGHISLPKLKVALQQGMRTGTDITINAIDRAIARGFKCIICDKAKVRSSPEPRKSGHQKTEDILGIVHTDLMERPEGMASIHGNIYTQVFCDEATHRVKVKHLKNKDEVYGAMREVEKEFQRDAKDCIQAAHRNHISIRKWRSDGDGMFNGKRMAHQLLEKLQGHDRSAPHKHNNNSFIERQIRTISDMTRALMVDSGLPPNMWEEAVNYAVVLLNTTPIKSP